MLMINALYDETANRTLEKQISSRLLDVVQFPLTFIGSGNYRSEDYENIREMFRNDFSASDPDEMAEDYCNLCRALETEAPRKLSRSQRSLLNTLLSDYLDASSWAGEDTFEELDDAPAILENIKESAALNQCGKWKAPKFYGKSLDLSEVGATVLGFLSDVKNYGKLLAS